MEWPVIEQWNGRSIILELDFHLPITEVPMRLRGCANDPTRAFGYDFRSMGGANRGLGVVGNHAFADRDMSQKGSILGHLPHFRYWK